jgi:hypothetical protein
MTSVETNYEGPNYPTFGFKIWRFPVKKVIRYKTCVTAEIRLPDGRWETITNPRDMTHVVMSKAGEVLDLIEIHEWKH